MEKSTEDVGSHYAALPDEPAATYVSEPSSAPSPAATLVEISTPASADNSTKPSTSHTMSADNKAPRYVPGSKSWVFTSGSSMIGHGPRYKVALNFMPVETIFEHVEDISVSNEACVALSHDGKSSYIWGRYGFPSYPAQTEISIPQGTRIVQHLVLDSSTQYVLLDDGQLMIKGTYYSAAGRQRSETLSLVPVPLPSLRKIAAIHACVIAIDMENRLWEWGVTTASRDMPMHIAGPLLRVVNVPAKIFSVENEEFIDVCSGANHWLAVSSDGRLWSWGVSDIRLGRNGESYRNLTPQQRVERDCKVPTLVDFPEGVLIARVACRGSCNLALDRSGKIWTWGHSSRFLLGDGSGADAGVPTLVATPPDVIFRYISVSEDPVAFGITIDGLLYGWGKQEQGQLGVGHKTHVATPTLIDVPEKVAKVVAAPNCAIILTQATFKKFGVLKTFVGDFLDIFSTDSAVAPNLSSDTSVPSTAQSAYVAQPTAPGQASIPKSASSYSLSAAPSTTVATNTMAYSMSSNMYGYSLQTNYGMAIPAAQIPLAQIDQETGEETLPLSYGMDTSINSLYGSSTELSQSDKPETEIALTYSFNGSESTSSPLNVPQTLTKSVPVPVTQGRDWNEEFQTLLSLPSSTQEETDEKDRELLILYQDFVERVKAIACQIIEEVALPPTSKTIRSLAVGGVAGGEKFIVDNIFLKFAIDMHGIYGGDEWSRKAASLELLGQDAYLSCQATVPDLRTPLMALVDYRGFRILATCVLPLQKGSSLVYGSDDGGRTCHADDVHINGMMEKCGEILNLKAHAVTNSQVIIHAPCDIEVHRGKDNNIYVLDTARVFPPEFPFPLFGAIKLPSYEVEGQILKLELDKGQLDILVKDLYCAKTQEGLLYYSNKGAVNKTASAIVGYEILGEAYLLYGIEGRILYYQLRPEFVRSHPTPLSSDACSMFGRHNCAEHNTEIKDASLKLRQVVLPSFAQSLDSGKIVISSTDELVQAMHSAGINLRYLGNLRYFTASQSLKKLIFSEMICRCLKNLINRRMRTVAVRGGSGTVLRHEMLRLFNQLFGESVSADFFWTQMIKILLMAKYKDCLTGSELDRTYDIREDINLGHIFQVVQYRTGVFFSSNCIVEFDVLVGQREEAKSHSFGSERSPVESPFRPDDLEDITPSVKTMKSIGSRKEIFRRIRMDASIPRNPFEFVHSETLLREKVLQPLQNATTRIQYLFGQFSRETVTIKLHTALVCMLNPTDALCDEAETLALEVRSTLLDFFSSVGLGTVATYYHVLGRINQYRGDFGTAERMYLIAFGALLRLSGTIPFLFDYMRVAENGFKVCIHSSAVLILNQFLELLWDRLRHHNSTNDISLTFNELCRILPFPGDVDAVQRVFNSQTPLGMHQLLTGALQQHVAVNEPLDIQGFATFNGDLPISDEQCVAWVQKVLPSNESIENACPVEVVRGLEFAMQFVPPAGYTYCRNVEPYIRYNIDYLTLEYLIPNNHTKHQVQIYGAEEDGLVSLDVPNAVSRSKSQIFVTLNASDVVAEIDLSSLIPPLTSDEAVSWWEINNQDGINAAIQVRGPQRPTPNRFMLSWGPFVTISVSPIPEILEDVGCIQARMTPDPYLLYGLSADGKLYSRGYQYYLGRHSSSGHEFNKDILPMEGIVGREFKKFDVSLTGSFNSSWNPSLLFCGLTTSGELYTMGNNSSGAVGVADDDRTKTLRLLIQLHGTPIHDFALGVSFICAITPDGKAFIWGEFQCHKEISWNTRDDSVVPQPTDNVKPLRFGSSPTPVKLPAQEKCIWVSAGPSHVTLVTDHGDVYYAGLPRGLEDSDPRSTALETWNLLEIVDEETDTPVRIKMTACGHTHTVFLSEDGRVYAFGENNLGQCATGTHKKVPFSPYLKPVKFQRYGKRTSAKIVQIVAWEFNTAALDSEGFVWIWGRTIVSPVKVDTKIESIRSISFIAARKLMLSVDPAPVAPLQFEAKLRPRKPKAGGSGADAAAIVQSEEMKTLLMQQLSQMLMPINSQLLMIQRRLDRLEQHLGLEELE